MSDARSGEAMGIKAILVNETKPTPLSLAFARQGVNVHYNQWAPADTVLNEISACFVNFYDCVSHPFKVYGLSRKLRQRNIPLIAWNRDAPGYMNKPKWQLDVAEKARFLDIYLSHALPDNRRFGNEQHLLHNAVQPEHYNLAGTSLDQLDCREHYRYDVTFFGAIDGRKYKEYRKRQEFFSQLSRSLIEHDIAFNFIDTLMTPLTTAQQVKLIQTSKINLNFDAGCEYGSPVGYGLPERCFGIPACGGFLLSDYRTHAADAFAPELEWADFSSPQAAIDRIRHHLDHFEETRAIAHRAHQRVMTGHTYDHRARQVLELIGEWHQNRHRPPR